MDGKAPKFDQYQQQVSYLKLNNLVVPKVEQLYFRKDLRNCIIVLVSAGFLRLMNSFNFILERVVLSERVSLSSSNLEQTQSL